MISDPFFSFQAVEMVSVQARLGLPLRLLFLEPVGDSEY
jgi:hypothetical protein